MRNTTAIQVEHLDFGFTHPVLRDLSFTVERGDFVSFVGPSGSGKTTLLYLLLGLYDGYGGSLRVSAETVSFVFQHDSLLEWRDALSNVLLPFESRGEKITPELRARGEHTLGLVGLSGQGHLFPSELSGGMKKRVEIARALVTRPDLLILDEPFSSLDIMSRERLNILIGEIHRDARQTVVMVTHSVEEACFLSDRVYVLSHCPASITKVETINRGNGDKRETFSLTAEERRVDAAIRSEAKALWTQAQDPVREDVHPKMHGGPAAAMRGLVGSLRGRVNLWLIPAEIVVIFLVLALLKARLHLADYIYPSPFSVLSRFFATLLNGTIFPDLAATVYESAFGFAVAFVITLSFGYVIAKSRVVSNLFMPHLIALNTIPSVALAPLLVLWFGFGYTPKVVTCVIVMFFPMLINNVSAIRLASERMSTLVRFYRPPALTAFTKFELPAALPVIFSGVKVSITLSVIGAVVGEFVSGRQGLGALVNIAKANFDMDMMFVALVWLALLGIGYYALANGVYAIVQSRRRSARSATRTGG